MTYVWIPQQGGHKRLATSQHAVSGYLSDTVLYLLSVNFEPRAVPESLIDCVFHCSPAASLLVFR